MGNKQEELKFLTQAQSSVSYGGMAHLTAVLRWVAIGSLGEICKEGEEMV